jgi:spoIIIJ-associated protein
MAADRSDTRGSNPQDEEAAIDEIERLIEVVCDGLALDGEINIVSEDDTIRVSVEGDDLGLLIGRHGQTIDAVQHLAYKVAGRMLSPTPKVFVDAAGYREKRESLLIGQADRAAADALKNKRPVALESMSASDRKIVHEYLKGTNGVETYSEGEEPHRHLVVAPL